MGLSQLKIIFTVSFLFSVAFVSINSIRMVFLSKRESERITEEWSTVVSLLVYAVITFSGIAEYFIVSRNINFTVSLLGLGILTTGMLLRNLSIRALGKSWSIHTKADKVKKIIRRGPYMYLRHPYYLGSLAILLGILLMANSYYSLIMFFLFQIPVYIFRAYIEEEMLLRKFREEYYVYQKRVPAFVPLKEVLWTQKNSDYY